MVGRGVEVRREAGWRRRGVVRAGVERPMFFLFVVLLFPVISVTTSVALVPTSFLLLLVRHLLLLAWHLFPNVVLFFRGFC